MGYLMLTWKMVAKEIETLIALLGLLLAGKSPALAFLFVILATTDSAAIPPTSF
jgi:hypothetical protein